MKQMSDQMEKKNEMQTGALKGLLWVWVWASELKLHVLGFQASGLSRIPGLGPEGCGVGVGGVCFCGGLKGMYFFPEVCKYACKGVDESFQAPTKSHCYL